MYEVKWTSKAKRQLKKLEKRHQDKLVAMADSLRDDPFRRNTKKMQGMTNTYRLKMGVLRVVYSVYKKQLCIEIIKAGFRQGIYKK